MAIFKVMPLIVYDKSFIRSILNERRWIYEKKKKN